MSDSPQNDAVDLSRRKNLRVRYWAERPTLLPHDERNFEIMDDLLICQSLKERFGKTITASEPDKIFSTSVDEDCGIENTNAANRPSSSSTPSTDSCPLTERISIFGFDRFLL